MQWYHYALAFLALLAAAASSKTPRALLWIAALTVSFVVSVGYLRFYDAIEGTNQLSVFTADTEGFVPLEREWLPPSVVQAMCDAAVVFLIIWLGRERWERPMLLSIVMGMFLLNLVYATGIIMNFPPVPPREVLGILLEVLNVAALLLIGGTGILDRVKAHGDGGARWTMDRVLGGSRSFLHTPTRRKAFWQE